MKMAKLSRKNKKKTGKEVVLESSKKIKKASIPSKITVKVDSQVISPNNYDVFIDSNKIYSCTLNQSNLMNNNNKYYIIQVLKAKSRDEFFLWNRWGRVGYTGSRSFAGPLSKQEAIKGYNSKFNSKTKSGNYVEIKMEIENTEEKENLQIVMPKQGLKKSTYSLHPKVIDLINLIFDKNLMNQQMNRLGYDSNKMPLGKLSKEAIKEGYNVLKKISELLNSKKKVNRNDLIELSSQFYTLIPHNIGFKNMMNFILDTKEKVIEKLSMLKDLSDMKITNDIVTINVQDNYKKLDTDIEYVDKTSADYKLISKYIQNTKGAYSQIEIEDIYRIEKEKPFNEKLGNKNLLWHGSGLANYVGILSQGLRIAPPEAPVSGYALGKGIYFADMIQKSFSFCRSWGGTSSLVMLVEVALGKQNILNNYTWGKIQLNGKDSVKCQGIQEPSYNEKFKGMNVPLGKPTHVTNQGIDTNEFVVYNVAQAKIRYLIKVRN